MDELIAAMGDLDEDLALKTVAELQSSGMSTAEIMRVLNSGMLVVGTKFESGEYFLADLIVSGIIYRKALDLLGLEKDTTPSNNSGKVLIGVVKNDIHDIGKDIIVSTLRSEGYEVIDLGIDVSAEEFVRATLTERPDIVALSGTMSFAAQEMELTIRAMEKAHARQFVKVIVGGYGVDAKRGREIKADGYAKDPIGMLSMCEAMLGL